MEDIIDADKAHAKRVGKDFEMKNVEEYHDLSVQSDTLLLANIFENFWNMSCNIWAWSCKISFNFRISMAGSFKKG